MIREGKCLELYLKSLRGVKERKNNAIKLELRVSESVDGHLPAKLVLVLASPNFFFSTSFFGQVLFYAQQINQVLVLATVQQEQAFITQTRVDHHPPHYQNNSGTSSQFSAPRYTNPSLHHPSTLSLPLFNPNHNSPHPLRRIHISPSVPALQSLVGSKDGRYTRK